MPPRLAPNPLAATDFAAIAADDLTEINRLWTIVRAFSSTAHQVNNALQVIGGHAELLDASTLEPAVRDRVQAIRAQVGKAAATIEQLLSYSRSAEPSRHALDLAALTDAAAAMVRTSLGRARIGVAVERPDSAPLLVAADRNRTIQALLSVLLSREDAARTVRSAVITARLERRPNECAVAVSVAGAGPLEAAPNAAEPHGAPNAVWLLAAARLAAKPAGRIVVSAGTSSGASGNPADAEIVTLVYPEAPAAR